MNKKTIRRALKRAEYMDSIGKLGAVGSYFNGHSYCIIGCLFSDDLIKYLDDEGKSNNDISFLYGMFKNVGGLLGMSLGEAQLLQDKNDIEGSLVALNTLREWAK